MNVSLAQLQRVQGAGQAPFGPVERPDRPGSDTGFADTLRNAVDRVDATQKDADAQIEAFVAGEQEDLHEVMISMNQARLHFQLMTEVRNKSLETYQELMRMQV